MANTVYESLFMTQLIAKQKKFEFSLEKSSLFFNITKQFLFFDQSKDFLWQNKEIFVNYLIY